MRNFYQEKESLIKRWLENGLEISNEILEAFRKVRREDFMLPEYRDFSYSDEAFPTLDNQTISQPFTVVFMTHSLELKKGNKVMEIGTGSGYQTAILAEIAYPGKVYSFEISNRLHNFARRNLDSYKNIELILGQWADYKEKLGKFDKILVTAACKERPIGLIEMLKENGILVAPIGNYFDQELWKIKKHKERIEGFNLGDFRFVPLKGKHGFE
ncbi:MAG: methyltransferase domain-containing protein [Nanoarchaeota archaeon]